jgi:5-methylcytosine-specific restriction endonuclease McrA
MSRAEQENEARKSRERQQLRTATVRSRKQKRKQERTQTRAVFRAAIPKFYNTPEWKRIRYEALKQSNGRCECCGAGSKEGATLNVDHILPRRSFPKLALDINNLQVLCAWCNEGKGNWDQTDWRIEQELDLVYVSFLRERGVLG